MRWGRGTLSTAPPLPLRRRLRSPAAADLTPPAHGRPFLAQQHRRWWGMGGAPARGETALCLPSAGAEPRPHTTPAVATRRHSLAARRRAALLGGRVPPPATTAAAVTAAVAVAVAAVVAVAVVVMAVVSARVGEEGAVRGGGGSLCGPSLGEGGRRGGGGGRGWWGGSGGGGSPLSTERSGDVCWGSRSYAAAVGAEGDHEGCAWGGGMRVGATAGLPTRYTQRTAGGHGGWGGAAAADASRF